MNIFVRSLYVYMIFHMSIIAAMENDNADLRQDGALFQPFLQPTTTTKKTPTVAAIQSATPTKEEPHCCRKHAKLIFAATAIAMLGIPTGIYFIINPSVSNSTVSEAHKPLAHFNVPTSSHRNTPPKHWIKNPVHFRRQQLSPAYPPKNKHFQKSKR